MVGVGRSTKLWVAVIVIIIVFMALIALIYYIPGVVILSDTNTPGSTGVEVELQNNNPFRSITVTVVAKIIFDNNEEYTNSRTFTLGPLEHTHKIIYVETPYWTSFFHGWTWETYIVLSD